MISGLLCKMACKFMRCSLYVYMKMRSGPWGGRKRSKRRREGGQERGIEYIWKCHSEAHYLYGNYISYLKHSFDKNTWSNLRDEGLIWIHSFQCMEGKVQRWEWPYLWQHDHEASGHKATTIRKQGGVICFLLCFLFSLGLKLMRCFCQHSGEPSFNEHIWLAGSVIGGSCLVKLKMKIKNQSSTPCQLDIQITLLSHTIPPSSSKPQSRLWLQNVFSPHVRVLKILAVSTI